MKKLLAILLAALMLLSLSSALAEEIEIAVVPKSLDNAIFLDAKATAEAKGEELGAKIYWEGPTTSDAAQQVNVVESLIERQVDGILISCNDADALKDVIDRAVDAGIVVGCFDSDSPPNLEMRITGFKETLEAANSPIEVMPVQTGEDDVQKSVEVVSQYTAANPDLAGWFFDGGWPYFADPDALPEVKAFMENGGHIVSIDTCYPMMQYVGLGMVDVLVGQNYPTMGALGVETLYKLITGEEVDLGDETHYIDTGYEVVDIENYEEVWANKAPW